ncbi:TPA: class D sortase [Bacillus luti]|nr:class D sortase [Bacillus luti]
MTKMNRVGLFLMIIGIVAGLYYSFEWYKGKSSAQHLKDEEVKQLEQKYNEVSVHSVIPSSNTQYKEGEKVAKLYIPKMEKKFTVYWGSSEETLKKGVGMYAGNMTTVPSNGGHTVLSGHRDTVFFKLGDLKEGDHLILEYDNKMYTYEIQKKWITHADDRTVIVKKKTPTLTLTTCYPFDYIGDAPDRYIVQAKFLRMGQ